MVRVRDRVRVRGYGIGIGIELGLKFGELKFGELKRNRYCAAVNSAHFTAGVHCTYPYIVNRSTYSDCFACQ